MIIAFDVNVCFAVYECKYENVKFTACSMTVSCGCPDEEKRRGEKPMSHCLTVLDWCVKFQTKM